MSDYSQLVKVLRDHEGWAWYKTLIEAADAIEELQKAVSEYEEDTDVEFVEENGQEYIRFVPKWIPVAKLPPKGETYGDTTFSVEVLGTEGFTYRKAYYNFKYNVWVDGNEEQEWPSITHWMPLPTPPKEEQK